MIMQQKVYRADIRHFKLVNRLALVFL
jgi:hypothetical protein